MTNQTQAHRIDKLRELMAQRGYDAVFIRNLADLRWLVACERVFDTEQAHSAFITQTDLFLHTDSRYYNTFLERLGTDTPWQIDQEICSDVDWCVGKIQKTASRIVAIEDTLDLATFDELSYRIQNASLVCMFPRLHADIKRLRRVKDEDELACMQKAQDITDAAFAYICTVIQPGMTEQYIRAELENYMLSHGADGLAFNSIIASGANGANPHAQPSEKKIEKGDMVVIDFGASYHDYCSDMTRTIVMSDPTSEQKEVYDIVRDAHEQCAKAIRTGAIGKDIYDLSKQIITDAGYGDYYNHGLGHGVGIEIHEEPNLSRMYAEPLEESSVVTCEPGIYLPGKFGIRLEDFGVVKQDGYHPFTRSSHELHVIAC